MMILSYSFFLSDLVFFDAIRSWYKCICKYITINVHAHGNWSTSMYTYISETVSFSFYVRSIKFHFIVREDFWMLEILIIYREISLICLCWVIMLKIFAKKVWYPDTTTKWRNRIDSRISFLFMSILVFLGPFQKT